MACFQVSLLEHLHAFPAGRPTIRLHGITVWIKDMSIYQLSGHWSTVCNGSRGVRRSFRREFVAVWKQICLYISGSPRRRTAASQSTSTGSSPTRELTDFPLRFLICVVLHREMTRDGPIPYPGSPTIYLKRSHTD
jgi:hypothetical protein